jgi:hypothetical protein
VHVTVAFDGTGVSCILVHDASPLAMGSQAAHCCLTLISLLLPLSRITPALRPTTPDSFIGDCTLTLL